MKNEWDDCKDPGIGIQYLTDLNGMRIGNSMKMVYCSTNRTSPDVPLSDALLQGQAPDMGLYMPCRIPRLSDDMIRSFSTLSYPEIATEVLFPYVSEIADRETLLQMAIDAYDFPVPLEKVEGQKYIMRLDRGPTASFKDFGARMMARLMQRVLGKRERDLLILTATSGDTGSAIANAFYGLEHIRVVILFPEGEVSTHQRRQMTTLHRNIMVLGINGKFDDCQQMVKCAFADTRLSHLSLSSANSINIGRLLPQCVYYFFAHSRLSRGKKRLIFSIPSGNFGDMMGGILAFRMGLPVKKLIVATNSNDEFPRFLNTGVYEKVVPSVNCISSAMNVGHPSNLARLVHIYGGQMDETGVCSRLPDLDRMRKDIHAVRIGDDRTEEVIREVYENYGVVMEPHGAVAWAGLKNYLDHSERNEKEIYVSIETAHPAKFPACFDKLLGFKPPLPASIKEVLVKEEKFERLDGGYENFFMFLIERFPGGR